MNVGRTIFSQLIECLPNKEFQKCVARYHGDSHWRGFSCWDQLLAMSFAQLTYRESLRDIEACLRSMSGKLYHMGLRGKVARSTLAEANETHDWRIYADSPEAKRRQLNSYLRHLATIEPDSFRLQSLQQPHDRAQTPTKRQHAIYIDNFATAFYCVNSSRPVIIHLRCQSEATCELWLNDTSNDRAAEKENS